MKAYHYVTGILFAIIALVQLARIMNHWEVVVGPWSMPVQMAWGPLVISAGLSIWSFYLLRKGM